MQSIANKRALPIKLLNRSGGLLKYLSVLRELNRKHLMLLAQEVANEDDFGELDFIEALDRLIESFNEDAQLNTVGQLAAQTYLLQLLTNRLKLEADRKRLGEINQREVSQPIFIIGLPRTGSTLLYELLCQDKQFCAPLSWQVMYPSPPPGKAVISDRWRRIKAAISLSAVDIIAPEFRKIHPLGAGLPQECIAIQAHSFRSIQFNTTNRVTRYQTWLEEEADWLPAYAYHKKFLQHLQVLKEPKTWLLKAPGHLYSMDALLQTYPEARFVQTHRDPLKVVPSITSHCLALRQAFSDHVNVREVGEFWAASWHEALKKTTSWRNRNPHLQDRILDLHYADLVSDTMANIRNIYQFFQLQLTIETESAMQAYIARHPQHKHGKHRYTLETLGFSEAEERIRFHDYMQEFEVAAGV